METKILLVLITFLPGGSNCLLTLQLSFLLCQGSLKLANCPLCLFLLAASLLKSFLEFFYLEEIF